MSETIYRIPLWPAGWALSAALAATFIVCASFELVAPYQPLAHDWVELFTVRPVTTALGWIEGLVGSVAFGWLFAAVAAFVFNRLARS